MILERFVLKYIADTSEATSSLDDLEKKAKRGGEDAGKDAGKSLSEGVAEGAADAEKNVASSAGKMEKILGGLGQSAKGLGSFGAGLLSHIPGAASIGGIGALGTMAGVAAAALGAMALSVAAAAAEAKKAEDMYKDAWATSRNVYDYNKQMVMGSRLGATDEETKANLSGISQKAMGAINQPFSEQAYWIKRSGMGGDLKQLKKTGNIDQYTKAVMEHSRAMAKTRGESQALAWATSRMGADFETTRRYIALNDEQVKQMNKGIGDEAFNRRVAQASMSDYVNSQRNLETVQGNINRQLASKVTPSLIGFTNKLTEIASETNGLVAVMGRLGAAVIDFATGAIGVIDKLVRSASGDYKGVYAETSMDIVGEQLEKIRTAKKDGNDGIIPELENRLKYAIKGYTEAAKAAGMSQRQIDTEINKKYSKYGRAEIPVAPEEPKAPKEAAPEFVKAVKGESDAGKSARNITNDGINEVQKAIDKMANYDSAGAAALQKSLDDLKKEAQEAAKDGTLKEFANAMAGKLASVATQIQDDAKDAAIVAMDGINKAASDANKTNEVFKAQQEHTQPVRVVQMPPPIGLEQAMSLWAAGIGKAAGLRANTGEPSGQSMPPPVVNILERQTPTPAPVSPVKASGITPAPKYQPPGADITPAPDQRPTNASVTPAPKGSVYPSSPAYNPYVPPNAQSDAPPVTSGSIGKSADPTPPPIGSTPTGKTGENSVGISGAEPAGSRSEWETEARRMQRQKLSPTYQPNALVPASTMNKAIGTAANVGVSSPGAGGVNITQHNTNQPNIKIEGGGNDAISQAAEVMKETWQDMTGSSLKHAVNEMSDNWKA